MQIFHQIMNNDVTHCHGLYLVRHHITGIRCEVCNLFTGQGSLFEICEKCHKITCRKCYIRFLLKDCVITGSDRQYILTLQREMVYSDCNRYLHTKCIDCYLSFFKNKYQTKLNKGWRARLNNLTNLIWLPVDIWKIIFHYTYRTNHIPKINYPHYLCSV